MSNEATISPILTVIRREIASQRAARRARVQLAEDLAQYRTAADRLEIQAILDRHSAEETEEIRSILGGLALAG